MENHNYIWATILKNKENTVKASFRTILFLLTFFSLAGTAKAQLKMGYILSERIHAEYDEFKEADLQMQVEYKKIQFRFHYSI